MAGRSTLGRRSASGAGGQGRTPDRLSRSRRTCARRAGPRVAGHLYFDVDVLVPALEADAPQHDDFGRTSFRAHRQDPGVRLSVLRREQKAAKFWRDIGTLDACFDANMDLCHVNPEFSLYDPSGRFGRTRSRLRPRSSSSPMRAAAAGRRSIRSSRPAASSREAGSPAACSARTSASTASATSIRAS